MAPIPRREQRATGQFQPQAARSRSATAKTAGPTASGCPQSGSQDAKPDLDTFPEDLPASTFVVSGGGWWPAELTGLPGRAEQASIGGSSSQGVTTDAHAEPTALARRPAHR